MPELINPSQLDLTKCIVIDATLLKKYSACQKAFDYFNNQHVVAKQKKAAPSFGIAMHEGIATFRNHKKAGCRYQESLDAGMKALLTAYKKHMPPESLQEVMQDDKRSPANALRIFEGYCQHYEPMALKFHHVEVPFAMHIGQVSSPTPNSLETVYVPRDVVYVGIIDAVLEMQGRIYVNDLKSTAWSISQNWLDGFQMDQGLIGYTVAARELLGIDTQHALVHGIWIQSPPKSGKGKPLDEYFHTKELYWDQPQLDEWHQNTLNKVQEIVTKQTTNGPWIMDYGQNCGAFSGCDYRPLCWSTPAARNQLISMDYIKAIWTPLEDERLQKMEE